MSSDECAAPRRLSVSTRQHWTGHNRAACLRCVGRFDHGQVAGLRIMPVQGYLRLFGRPPIPRRHPPDSWIMQSKIRTFFVVDHRCGTYLKFERSSFKNFDGGFALSISRRSAPNSLIETFSAFSNLASMAKGGVG